MVLSHSVRAFESRGGGGPQCSSFLSTTHSRHLLFVGLSLSTPQNITAKDISKKTHCVSLTLQAQYDMRGMPINFPWIKMKHVSRKLYIFDFHFLIVEAKSQIHFLRCSTPTSSFFFRLLSLFHRHQYQKRIKSSSHTLHHTLKRR